MHPDNLLLIKPYGKSRYSWHLHLGSTLVKSEPVDPRMLEWKLKTILCKKIRSLFSQRKYQLSHHLTGMEVDQNVIINLQAKVDHFNHWGSSTWRVLLKAMLPGLQQIAPEKGRFVEIWSDLLQVVELVGNSESVQQLISKKVHHAA